MLAHEYFQWKLSETLCAPNISSYSENALIKYKPTHVILCYGAVLRVLL